MNCTFDLTTLPWQLSGWQPHVWRTNTSLELGQGLAPDIPPVPARVPGSVQQALRDADLLPDWNVGLNSRQCEWVEHRHWLFTTELPAEWTAEAGRKVLYCEGLDYQGFVLVNGEDIGRFCGTFMPHTFDLTPHLVEGPNRLTIAFTDNPYALGQVGYTSQIQQWKARFNYGWDWTPRLVQIGIWDALRLEVQREDQIETLSLYTEFDARAGLGAVSLTAGLHVGNDRQVEIMLAGDDGIVTSTRYPAQADMRVTLDALPVLPWHPNGNGSQQLYTVSMRLLDQYGQVLDEETRRVGFRQIIWKACAGAPEGAEPWICQINGSDTFLQGVNWTPIRPNFADVTEPDYRLRLERYRDMGCNLLRVWGGAMLEKACFYDLCDELGLMVWQEFPLSSSGPENWPPETPQAIDDLADIAGSYIARRQHHPSLVIWCGGNELQGSLDGSKAGCGKPIDNSHPMMVRLGKDVGRLDPTRRFLPASASGPRFTAEAEDFGKGLHHDVHGPWGMHGALAAWQAYWDGDDALFRSETGFPGCSPADLIRHFGSEFILPADTSNPWYMHTGGWWIQWQDYLDDDGDPTDLDAYVAWSQHRQATALAYAANACKQRFPACGGILIWMGHDCYPCPVNTALFDYDGNPKPAALALGEVFRAMEIPILFS